MAALGGVSRAASPWRAPLDGACQELEEIHPPAGPRKLAAAAPPRNTAQSASLWQTPLAKRLAWQAAAHEVGGPPAVGSAARGDRPPSLPATPRVPGGRATPAPPPGLPRQSRPACEVPTSGSFGGNNPYMRNNCRRSSWEKSSSRRPSKEITTSRTFSKESTQEVGSECGDRLDLIGLEGDGASMCSTRPPSALRRPESRADSKASTWYGSDISDGIVSYDGRITAGSMDVISGSSRVPQDLRPPSCPPEFPPRRSHRPGKDIARFYSQKVEGWFHQVVDLRKTGEVRNRDFLAAFRRNPDLQLVLCDAAAVQFDEADRRIFAKLGQRGLMALSVNQRAEALQKEIGRAREVFRNICGEDEVLDLPKFLSFFVCRGLVVDIPSH